MKYATAISPARMNATGRVRKPTARSAPPTNSITPCNPSNDINAGCPLAGIGKPSNFVLPCSRNSSPTTIRAMLSISGKYLLTRSKFIGLSPTDINDGLHYSSKTRTASRPSTRIDFGERRSRRKSGQHSVPIVATAGLRKYRPSASRDTVMAISLPHRNHIAGDAVPGRLSRALQTTSVEPRHPCRRERRPLAKSRRIDVGSARIRWHLA